MRKVITDGGKKASGFSQESKDCTVRALSICCAVSYEEAHAALASEGRRTARPCTTSVLLRAVNKFKHAEPLTVPRELKNIYLPDGFYVQRWLGCNIKTFVQNLGPGRYLISIKKHVFAVIDGVIYDSFKQHAGARVQGAWRIL